MWRLLAAPSKWHKTNFELLLLGKPLRRKPYSIPRRVKSMVTESRRTVDFAGVSRSPSGMVQYHIMADARNSFT